MKSKQIPTTLIFVWSLILLAASGCTSIAEESPASGTGGPTLAVQESDPVSTDNQLPIGTENDETKETPLVLPTEFSITSTPDDHAGEVEITQAPEGKFLFVELVSIHDGRGEMPFGLIDTPAYYYRPEQDRLSTPMSLDEWGFKDSDLGFWGQKVIYQGARGSGVSSQLIPIVELPSSESVLVLNAQGTDLRSLFDQFEVLLVAVYEDGVVALSISGVQTLLPPGEVWEHRLGANIDTDIIIGFYETNTQIINHGWLDLGIIQARP